MVAKIEEDSRLDMAALANVGQLAYAGDDHVERELGTAGNRRLEVISVDFLRTTPQCLFYAVHDCTLEVVVVRRRASINITDDLRYSMV